MCALQHKGQQWFPRSGQPDPKVTLLPNGTVHQAFCKVAGTEFILSIKSEARSQKHELSLCTGRLTSVLKTRVLCFEKQNSCTSSSVVELHNMLRILLALHGKAGHHSYKIPDSEPTWGLAQASGSGDKTMSCFLRGCLSLGPVVAVTFSLLLLSLTLLNDLVLWDLAFLQQRTGPRSSRFGVRGFDLWLRPQSTRAESRGL